MVPLSSPPFLKEYSGFNIGLPRSTAFGGIMSNSTKNYLKSFVKKKKRGYDEALIMEGKKLRNVKHTIF